MSGHREVTTYEKKRKQLSLETCNTLRALIERYTAKLDETHVKIYDLIRHADEVRVLTALFLDTETALTVKAYIAQILSTRLSEEDDKAYFRHYDGIRTLIELLYHDDATQKIKERLATALGQFASSLPHYKSEIGFLGGIEVLLTLLTSPDASSSLIEAVTDALASLTIDNRDNQYAIHSATPTLIDLLTASTSTKNTKQHLTKILLNIAHHLKGYDSLIPALIQLIQDESSTNKTKITAARLLWALKLESHQKEIRNHSHKTFKRIEGVGGITTLLWLLRYKNKRAQEFAVRALYQLARYSDDNRKIILENQGVSTVATVLRTTKNAKTRAYSAALLGAFSVTSEELNDPALKGLMLGALKPAVAHYGVLSFEEEAAQEAIDRLDNYQALLDEIRMLFEGNSEFLSALEAIDTFFKELNSKSALSEKKAIIFPENQTQKVLNELDNMDADERLIDRFETIYNDFVYCDFNLKYTSTPFAQAGAGSGQGGPTGRDKHDPEP